MAEPDPLCVPSTWGPCAPYLDAEQAQALGCCPGVDLNDEATLALYERSILWASRRLFEATGGLYPGCCTAEVRPLPAPCMSLGSVPTEFAGQYLPPAIPVVVGQDANGPLLVNCWTCGVTSLSSRPLLALPFLPVRSVESITIDGDELPGDAWRLRPGTNLVARLDGEAWPVLQDPDADAGEPGTWSVRFRWGLDLPPEALPLVGMYACELTKLCQGGECQLAPGVRIVSRPGVEYDDVVVGDGAALTGFAALDDWIVSMRGGHTTVQPRIYLPGRSTSPGFLEG